MANANLDFSGLSVTRTFTFPDATGTVALTIGSSSIVTVGTITTGVWHGTKIGLLYGGTNADLSGTGGTSQVLQQSTSGAAITVGQLAIADLSNAANITPGAPAQVAPTTGGTVTVTPAGPITVESINPTGTLANLTLTISNGTFDGQVVFAAFSQIITALAYGGTNITATNGLALPNSAAVGDSLGFVWKVSGAKWTRFK